MIPIKLGGEQNMLRIGTGCRRAGLLWSWSDRWGSPGAVEEGEKLSDVSEMGR